MAHIILPLLALYTYHFNLPTHSRARSSAETHVEALLAPRTSHITFFFLCQPVSLFLYFQLWRGTYPRHHPFCSGFVSSSTTPESCRCAYELRIRMPESRRSRPRLQFVQMSSTPSWPPTTRRNASRLPSSTMTGAHVSRPTRQRQRPMGLRRQRRRELGPGQAVLTVAARSASATRAVRPAVDARGGRRFANGVSR